MEGDQNAAFSLNIQSYFNPLPPHGGRPGFSVAHRPHGEISIHSLRMEGDGIIANKKEYQGISIHSLRMEGDLVQRELYTDNHHFNPLPPHGGRLPCREIPSGTTHFNPLPPHGGRLYWIIAIVVNKPISIHSLRMEGDHNFPAQWGLGVISIHSLRMEGDNISRCVYYRIFIFQSTPSAWRETTGGNSRRRKHHISIHSLRMEGDFYQTDEICYE